ncbi:la domain-containing protein [Trichoderma breve]|uniref:La domain-containing protein n=1 Tax=Trichoderma breve TaxID=2034170 RepID=A0A9W9BG99_9HYPO|nr:la domain-containing protein [Trichoderma breve]KAJ4859261.1 la domain-containing protein [Trichoderma breve]
MSFVSRSPKTWPYAQSSAQDSVGKLLGTLHPGLLGDILCWEAKGEARRLFESSLKKSILDYLLEHSDKAQESGSYLSIPLFMVGKRAKRAKPVVMLVSDDKVARKEAYDLILHSDIMAKYPGFELGHSDFEKLMAWAGDSVSVFSLQQEGTPDCYRLISGQEVSDKEASDRQVSGRKILASASLGALGTESIARARNVYGDRSRGDDTSPDRNSVPKQGLGPAAAALAIAGAAKYLQAGKVEKEERRRGRSRSRSFTSSDDDHSPPRSRSRSRRRQRSTSTSAKAAVGTAAVAGLVQHFRNKSRTRSKSRSRSRLRSGSRSKSTLKRSISTSARLGLFRTATAGGVVSYMGKHMLLSISHFLRDSPSIELPAHKFEASQISDCEITGLGDFDDDDDDETDTDFVETVRQGSVSDVDESKDSEMDDSYTPTSASESDRNSQRRLSISLQEPSSPEGRLIGKGKPVVCSEELDYAFFEVDMSSPSESPLNNAISLTDLDKIESGPRNTAVKTVASNGRVVHGLMSEDTLPVRLPHSKGFTEVYTARFFGSLGPGDCGGWVRDKVTGRLFGHVFAGNLSNGLTAIMPAKLVFEHARAQLDQRFALTAHQNQNAAFSFSALKEKVEYYFSIENLAGDLYLRARMDSQGFVPLHLITSFKGMRQLTDDIDIVRAVCEFSVELDFAVGDDGIERVRRSQGWESFVLPLDERDESARNSGPAYLSFKNRELKPHHKLQELKQSTLQSIDDNDDDSTYGSAAKRPLSLPKGITNMFRSRVKQAKLVKKYVCRDPTAAGLYSDVKPDFPLSQCPECSSGKTYNAYYMAADHLRRRHFQRHYQETLVNSNSRVVRLSSAVSDLRLWTEEVLAKADEPLGSSIAEVTEDEASHSTEKVSPSQDVTKNVSPSYDANENASPSHDVNENVSPSHDVNSSGPSFQPLTDAPFPYPSFDRVEPYAPLYPSWNTPLPGLSFSPHSVSTATPSSIANSPYQLYNVNSYGSRSQFQVIEEELNEVPGLTSGSLQGYELYQPSYNFDPLAPAYQPLEGPPSAAYAPKISADDDFRLYGTNFSPLTSPVLTSSDFSLFPAATTKMDESSSSAAPIVTSRQAIASRSSGRLSSDQRRKSSKFLCTICNDHPGGFRGPHELDRHMRRHDSNKMTRKFICRDPTSVGIKPDIQAINPLSKCKSCLTQEQYDTVAGAISHLYIEHMIDPSTRKSHADQSKRSLIEQLKVWCCEVQVDGNGRILAQAGDASAALQAEGDDIPGFLKALDSHKTLKSFEPGKKGESATSRTVAQLSKFQQMRESNNALTESMTSSMQLDHSSIVSSRQLDGMIYTEGEPSAMDCDDDNEDTEMTSDIPEPSGSPPAGAGGPDVQEIVCSNCFTQDSLVWPTSPEEKPLCVDCSRNLPTSQDSARPSYNGSFSPTAIAVRRERQAQRERKAQEQRDHALIGDRRGSMTNFLSSTAATTRQQQYLEQLQQPPRSSKRPRPVVACIECRKRKTRCDGQYPCLACHRSNRSCKRADPGSFNPSVGSDAEVSEPHMAPWVQDNISKPFASVANAFKNSLLSRQPERELTRNRSRSITKPDKSQTANTTDTSPVIGTGGVINNANVGAHKDLSRLHAGLASPNDVDSDDVRHTEADRWLMK